MKEGKNQVKSAKDSVHYCKLNEDNVVAYLAKLRDSSFTKILDVKELIHIFSGELASQTVSKSLLNFRQTCK